MSALKRLFSDTLLYGISSVLARLIGYLLVPFLTHVFLPDEYGRISLVFLVLGVLNVVFTLGQESAFLRHATGKSGNDFKRIFNTLLFTLGAYSLVLSFMVWVSRSIWLPWTGITDQASQIPLYVSGILVADTLGVIGFAALRLQHRAKVFASLKLSQVSVNALLTYILITYYAQSIEMVFLANLVASGAAMLAVNGSQWHAFSLQWDMETQRKALQFGLPFVPAGLAHLINEGIDRFFLLRMQPERIVQLYDEPWSAEDVVGIYSACYKLAVFMLLLVQMFRMAWQPFFLEEAKKDHAPTTFAEVFSLVTGVLVFAWMSVSLFAADIAAFEIPGTQSTLIGRAYWGGLFIVPFLLGAYIFQGWFVVFSSNLFLRDKTSVFPKITAIGAVFTLIGNMLFTPNYGMLAAALITLGSYFLMSMMLWRAGKDLYPVPYKFGHALALVLVAFGAVLCYHTIPLFNQLLSAKLGLFLTSGLLIALLTIQGSRSIKKTQHS